MVKHTEKLEEKKLPTDVSFFLPYTKKLTFIQGQEKEQNFIRYLCTSKSYSCSTFLTLASCCADN